MTALIDSIGYAGWALHALIWLPVLGIGLVLWAEEAQAKTVAFWWSIFVFVLSLGLWWAFDPSSGTMQMESTTPWISAWGVNYSLGVDGISLFMVMLTTFSTSIAILGSFNYIKTKERAFYALMLLLEAAVIGVFTATDVFLFYVFFELTLVPMYFIVGVWGGQRRIYAAIKFFLYTAFGSLLMLVAILYLFWRAKTLLGFPTFAYYDLLQVPLTGTEQLWLFAAFALAFSVKVPVFPLHTWLPDAHVEAPTPGSVILAAVLLKMGTYGFLRFLLPLFPVAAQHPTVVTTMMVLAVIGILYTAWVAAVQPDAKKLVAYTSVAHMGFVVLGVFALTVNGLQGGLVVMISHGISTGALFLLLGMLYERRHTRTIADFGGIARVAPWFATAFLITALASIGLPGTSGFVGEFLALLGAFETHPRLAFVATLGVIFAAYYMLPMVQTVFFNKLESEENRQIEDLTRREMVILAPLCALMLVIGWHPTPVLERMEPSVRVVLERVEEANNTASVPDTNPTEVAQAPLEGAGVDGEAGEEVDDAAEAVPDESPETTGDGDSSVTTDGDE